MSSGSMKPSLLPSKVRPSITATRLGTDENGTADSGARFGVKSATRRSRGLTATSVVW